jgi:hypothetical protein
MQRTNNPVATTATSTDDITRLTVTAFVSVLVGLVLKTSLDTFFHNAAAYSGAGAAVSAFINRGSFGVIVTGQLLIFLFTLVRFYLGSFRYHQKDPGITPRPEEMMIDLIGVFGVFVSFYIAAVFIKTTGLFYVGFASIQIVDLLWFLIAGAYLNLTDGMRKVADWYVFFDVLTLICLIAFFVLEEYWGPWPSYFPQWFALGATFAIGIWDLITLWPFYAGKKDWSDSLKELFFSRKILTLGKRYTE